MMRSTSIITVLLLVCITLSTTQRLKPGLCPNPTRMSTYSECRSDDNCQGNFKCCQSLGRRTTICTQPRLEITTPKPTVLPVDQVKPGICPTPTTRPSFSNCRADASCTGDMKCCATLSSAKVCTKPVAAVATQPNTATPSCPDPQKHPGVWACSSMCRTDYDCFAGTNCCENRCGAKVCT